LNRLSRAHERYKQQTTDGRATANSEREREFAKNGFIRRGLEIYTVAYSLEKLRRLMAADGGGFGVYKEVGLGPGHIVLDGDPVGTQPPQQPLPTFGPSLLWPNGRPPQQLLSSCSNGRPKT